METKYPFSTPELWGGLECTVNRVGNVYRDQLMETGHYERKGDIRQFGKLGITKLRYPILWEKHQANANGSIDWGGISRKLDEIRHENMTPIAGLVHHGSGPADTSLLDPGFAEKLAKYASQVALAFPWLMYYTPVNEPLTTARFSGLYGYWYPHRTDEKSFVTMFLNQVKGIILSMQAIRAINPAALLVQTEDLCKVHATPGLAYQANFENERRWLTYDLLCGFFKPGHVLWDRFIALGIAKDELAFFMENNCPPDIMGFNYYVTSERYLDEQLHNYPLQFHGRNDQQLYADMDAARTNHRQGIKVLLKEAWERYRRPMAVTECHLNCTREEQLRWLKETWDACCDLNSSGIPIKALTAWSLLGSYDWDSLLTRHNRHYESGVFDIRTGHLRTTIAAKYISALASGKYFNHALLDNKGWWHKRDAPTNKNGEGRPAFIIIKPCAEKITDDFEQVCDERGIHYKTLSLPDLYKDPVKPWGAVLMLCDDDINKMTIWNSATVYCRRYQIPLMIISWSFLELTPRDELLIFYEGGSGMKFAHEAMDLFIDAEKGAWCVNKDGARKLFTEEPATRY